MRGFFVSKFDGHNTWGHLILTLLVPDIDITITGKASKSWWIHFVSKFNRHFYFCFCTIYHKLGNFVVATQTKSMLRLHVAAYYLHIHLCHKILRMKFSQFTVLGPHNFELVLEMYWYAIFPTICFYLLPAIICRYRYCHSNFGI